MIQEKEFKLENVKYFSQRDNEYVDITEKINVRYISCFPTSLGMGMQYCLDLKGLTKEVVGCSETMQIEDYINQMIDAPETLDYLTKTFPKTWWGWNYKKRTVFEVEKYIFNTLMNSIGYKAEVGAFKYEKYCEILLKNKLPIIMSGDFSSVSRVSGHVVCCCGFNAIGMQELICHDPYGSALNQYKDGTGGEFISYGTKFFIKKDGLMYGLILSKI